MENTAIKLSEVEIGKTFKIGEFEFIKFKEKDGRTTAVMRNCVFDSEFGKDNNFAESKVLKRLSEELLPQIAKLIGEENICEISTDLTTLDGLKPYETLTSKVSLPTIDFYRENVHIFDQYPVDEWWWLATPESAKPHSNPYWIVCVSPVGCINRDFYDCNCGVRPFWSFVSSISVSCEE